MHAYSRGVRRARIRCVGALGIGAAGCVVGAELGGVDVVLVAAEGDGGDAEGPVEEVEDGEEAEEGEVGGGAADVGVGDCCAHLGRGRRKGRDWRGGGRGDAVVVEIEVL